MTKKQPQLPAQPPAPLPTPQVIDMKLHANFLAGWTQFITWVTSGADNSAIEVICPHVQMRDFLGQYILDSNTSLGRVAFRISLFESKDFVGNVVRVSYSIFARKLPAPAQVVPLNRRARRATKARARRN